MRVPHRAALFYHPFPVYWAAHPPSSVTHFSLRGFSKKSPAKYFLRVRHAPLTGESSGPTQAGS